MQDARSRRTVSGREAAEGPAPRPGHRRGVRSGLRRARWIAVLALVGASPGFGEGEPGAGTGETPRVHLDQLLELPAGRSYQVEKRGGMTRQEWAGRFQALRDGLRDEKAGLAKAETELEDVAGDAEPWTLGPALPGVTGADAPLDYRLRQEIRRHRSEIERLEDRLTELQVQADLASVPEAWRGRPVAEGERPAEIEELR